MGVLVGVGVFVAVAVGVLVGVMVPVGVTVGVAVGTQPMAGLQAPGQAVSIRTQVPLTHMNIVHASLVPQSLAMTQPGVVVAV